MALQGQLLGVQRLIFLSNSSMFPEIVTSGSIMFQISGPRYLKVFRPLLTVLIGPVVKSVCDQRF